MQGARRQPSCSHLCDLVLSPRQQRRPSIINPALSSQGSSHNMSSHVILFFFPSCIVFSAVNSSPRSVVSSTRTAARERARGKALICCFSFTESLSKALDSKWYSQHREKNVLFALVEGDFCGLFPAFVRRSWAILLLGGRYHQHLLFSAKKQSMLFGFLLPFLICIPL